MLIPISFSSLPKISKITVISRKNTNILIKGNAIVDENSDVW